MDVGESAIEISVDGKKYTIDLADLTGQETGLFRQAVGLSPAQALTTGLDLDCIAAFVWIARKRTERALSYQDVAKRITWRNIELEVPDDTPEAVEAESPEA